MLKIPQENQGQKNRKNNIDDDIESQEASYKHITDTVNQAKIPRYQSDDNILDELNQFDSEEPKAKPIAGTIKQRIPEEELLEEAPSPQQENIFMYPQQTFQKEQSMDQTQEIIESVVEEKWQELTAKLGDFNLWKDRVENELMGIKQEIIRTQSNFANLQRAVFGKVSEYNDNISNLNSEMKALESVFEKIMQPLTSNVKELSKITEKLKEKNR
ncbi:hypothetical protein J4214_01980 [Candidatus Woesearchaeota archaeon]|nr:hypothetical protein [Candidatus Woesearchaeota archaeon]